MAPLSKKQLEKYDCSIFLNEIGSEGQSKLLNSKILVIGAGGLASSTISYLMSVGINTLGVVDFDKVNLSNLPRQIIYDENDLGKLKTDVVKNKFEKKNEDTILKTYCLKLDNNNASDIFKDYDIVLDCVDNFDTKFVINDACIELGIPLVSAGVSGFKGQVMMVSKQSKHDFKSLFSTYPKITEKEKMEDRGVFPLAVALVSNVQCAEALKYLLGIGEPLIDEILVIDTIKMNFEKFKI